MVDCSRSGLDDSDLSLSIEVFRNAPISNKLSSPLELLSSNYAVAAADVFDWDNWKRGSGSSDGGAGNVRGQYARRGRGRRVWKRQRHHPKWGRRETAENRTLNDDASSLLLQERSTSFQNPVYTSS